MQQKFKIPDVDVAYGFAFAGSQEVRGTLRLARQDFFIDVDLEKVCVSLDMMLLLVTLSGSCPSGPEEGCSVAAGDLHDATE